MVVVLAVVLVQKTSKYVTTCLTTLSRDKGSADSEGVTLFLYHSQGFDSLPGGLWPGWCGGGCLASIHRSGTAGRPGGFFI